MVLFLCGFLFNVVAVKCGPGGIVCGADLFRTIEYLKLNTAAAQSSV